MSSTTTKIGHGLAKGLGIKIPYRDPLGSEADPVTRGESVFTTGTAETYIEPEPTVTGWIREQIPTWNDVFNYVIALFPFLKWITRYNMQWFIGDLVAGITVGAVVVPQGMSYAQLADLPVEYGLYSSFMGVLIYWFFATSKDITIGPVAVMSTLTGNVIISVQKEHPEIPGPVIASALAIIAGAIITFIGLIRWGWIVEFIPLTAITAFMTGSALNIASGQIKNLMGEKDKFNTRGATYMNIINSLKHLPSTQLDAALGLTALVMLYGIRSACNYGARKRPHKAKMFFFISTLRTAFVILFYTMISAATNIHRRKHPAFSVLGNVPRGFKHAAVPTIDTSIIKAFVSYLPSAVIVLLIEHISISKSFGRVNNYTIDPSQEMVAIGVTNLLGPFLGAYPATGSFSRTAIKSKAGVRTPLAGLITAIVVLLAIYALPPLFWYIPQAALSAVIIHAVGDLITPPNVVYQFWLVSPLEVVVFFAGVFVTVFSSIENGVYTTICMSVFLLLWRLVKARGDFLGKVRVHSVIGDHLIDEQGKYGPLGSTPEQTVADDDVNDTYRNVYLPVTHGDGSNPRISVQHPYPGVFIYRFSEGFVYPNANSETDYLVSVIFKETRRTNLESYPTLGDRPWNDPGPRRGKPAKDTSDLPTLRAIILDFSSVDHVDVTSIQNLIDVRNQLDLYANPEPVQWHFANINNRWTKRALTSAGFGYPTPTSPDGFKRWKPIFSVAEIGGRSSAAAVAERERLNSHAKVDDLEEGRPKSATVRERNDTEISSNEGDDYIKQLDTTTAYQAKRNNIALVSGLNRPFIHIDVTSAVHSAISNIEEHGSAKFIEE
ncbi:sulfate transporter, putative [Talaromyces stipitatus ATCC 10500]|uniref:Sulfate transporter, putative n=1 Tax=Talaromyces stipitatus (strain ATCC 10500 / CBS 375.48 / QM 6759 / NRRL 1006) TaxID=441959 RepID=B8MH31_TALSN|nr:sulfate transporter, putative [Talaromyces stipitatus ATCC 10500]EED16845.1 sulfate transporter, putative [Talaromyces stipitatus ATCC 10500]